MYKTARLIAILVLLLTLQANAQTYIFTCPTTTTTWTVPPGVTGLIIDMRGGTGGENSIGATGPTTVIDRGGWGARVECTLTVVPGQVLNIYVGGAGSNGVGYATGPGGFNGGGIGQSAPTAGITPGICGGGGGGASDIRIGGTALTDRVIVAGGGGGAGGNYVTVVDYDRGGDGGGTTGEAGHAGNVVGGPGAGGGGGTGSGGAGGPSLGFGLGAGIAGSLGVGGNGGSGSAGGGGGGGYYGGGGSCYGGGGGGSSYASPTLTSAVTHTRGYNSTGCGSVSITVICAPPVGGAISGPSEFCSGTTATYTNPTATAGGTWTSSDLSVATIDPATGVAVGAGPGIAVLTYSVTLSCGSASATKTITINPAPAAIAGGTNLCTGSTSTLSDATPGGTWTSSNTSVATIGSSTGMMTGVNIGVATMTYTLPTGCFVVAFVSVVGITGPTNVCVGDFITLAATSPGGTWTSGNAALASVGASTGIVTGLGMGIVPISYALASGCVSTWTVTVNPLAPILGRDSVCIGSDRWLTNIIGGGTWTSSTTAVATIVPDSGRVTGHAAGITTITYMLSTGCKTTASFTVIDYPNAITGTGKVCPGTSTGLFNSIGGGAWNSLNTGVATVDPGSGVVTGVFADTVDIAYTIEPGCAVYTRVTVNPLPLPITGIDIMCPNKMDSMHDATPDGLWSSTTPAIVTIVDTTGVIRSVAQGTGTVKYTLPTGCFVTRTVSVQALPIPAIIYNFVTKSFMASPGYLTYQWYDSIQGKIPGATSPTVAALNTEYYFVEVTDSNGCTGRSPLYYFDIKQLGISNTSIAGDIVVYPNPANAVIFISSPVRVRAVISSVDGRTLHEQPDAKEIDISKLAGGVYLLTLYDDKGTRLAVHKVTKE